MTNTRAIRIHSPGGPEVLRFESVPMPVPGEGEVLLRQTAVGVNFIDVYHRTGLYPLPAYPSGLGIEGAGVIEAIGAGVQYFKPGDRVAYGGGPLGAYAEHRVIAERNLVKIPDGVSDQLAAAIMVKGLTTFFLVRRTYNIRPGAQILVHAAAGGVGLALCQWAKHLGATVIGTVSTEQKAELARKHGCDHVILYSRDDVTAKVKELTGGQGVHTVYDSVGKDTFQTSIDCLRPLGLLVSFGQASGKIPPFDISLLQRKSLFLTRPTFMDYMEDQAEYIAGAAEMFDLVYKGKLWINVGQTYYLSDAASAHRDLEARKTHGSTLLLIDN